MCRTTLQLLCLARALIREANVIYIDEATSNVDIDTDALIQRTIRSEFAHGTVLTVAHRLNTIIDYDRVLVMGAGRLLELGSPAELLAMPGSQFSALVDETGPSSSAFLRAAAAEHAAARAVDERAVTLTEVRAAVSPDDGSGNLAVH